MRFSLVNISNPRPSGFVYDIDDNPLVLQNNEGFGFWRMPSVALEEQRVVTFLKRTVFGSVIIHILTGTNDAIQLITYELNAVSTAKVITIPTSAGAAIYIENTTFTSNDTQTVGMSITGGGAGVATINGLNQEVKYLG